MLNDNFYPNMQAMKLIMSLGIIMNLLVIISPMNHSVEARPSTLSSKKPPFNGSIFGKRSSLAPLDDRATTAATTAAAADSISRDETKLRAVLQEDIASGLGRIDSDPVVCNDCACFRRRLELFGCKLDNGRKWGRIWNAKNFVWQLWIGCERDPEGDFDGVLFRLVCGGGV
jgi:hypothetical protein